MHALHSARSLKSCGLVPHRPGKVFNNASGVGAGFADQRVSSRADSCVGATPRAAVRPTEDSKDSESASARELRNHRRAVVGGRSCPIRRQCDARVGVYIRLRNHGRIAGEMLARSVRGGLHRDDDSRPPLTNSHREAAELARHSESTETACGPATVTPPRGRRHHAACQ